MDRRAFSEDGFLIDQTLLGDVPNGRLGSDRNGCGWIAAYNALRLLGERVRCEWVARDVRRGLVLGGLAGTNAVFLQHFFRARGYRVRLSLLPGRFAALARTADACVLFYFHRRGGHFAALYPKDGKFRFLNARAGLREDVRGMEEFLQKEPVVPLCLLIALNKRVPPPPRPAARF